MQLIGVVGGVVGCAPCTEAIVLTTGLSPAFEGPLLHVIPPLSTSCLSSTALSIKGIKAQKIIQKNK